MVAASVQEIVYAFLQTYYQRMKANPSKLSNLYSNTAELTHINYNQISPSSNNNNDNYDNIIPTIKLTGRDNINKFFTRHENKVNKLKIKLDTCDFQTMGISHRNVLIVVTGELFWDGTPVNQFCQTFILIPIGKNSDIYEICNDIIRFIPDSFKNVQLSTNIDSNTEDSNIPLNSEEKQDESQAIDNKLDEKIEAEDRKLDREEDEVKIRQPSKTGEAVVPNHTNGETTTKEKEDNVIPEKPLSKSEKPTKKSESNHHHHHHKKSVESITPKTTPKREEQPQEKKEKIIVEEPLSKQGTEEEKGFKAALVAKESNSVIKKQEVNDSTEKKIITDDSKNESIPEKKTKKSESFTVTTPTLSSSSSTTTTTATTEISIVQSDREPSLETTASDATPVETVAPVTPAPQPVAPVKMSWASKLSSTEPTKESKKILVAKTTSGTNIVTPDQPSQQQQHHNQYKGNKKSNNNDKKFEMGSRKENGSNRRDRKKQQNNNGANKDGYYPIFINGTYGLDDDVLKTTLTKEFGPVVKINSGENFAVIDFQTHASQVAALELKKMMIQGFEITIERKTYKKNNLQQNSSNRNGVTTDGFTISGKSHKKYQMNNSKKRENSNV